MLDLEFWQMSLFVDFCVVVESRYTFKTDTFGKKSFVFMFVLL